MLEALPMRALAATSILLTTLCVGCARFEPRPLSARDSAQRLDSRTLTNSELKEFLSANLRHPLAQWPTPNWDFEMLTLTAFFYHPSLEEARAQWRVALGSQQTAAERPNPTVTASGAYEPAASAFSPWIPGLIFDLPFETAGKRRIRTEHAWQLTEVARLNVATIAWTVRGRVRMGLLELAAAQARASLLENQVALRQDLANRLDQQFQTGAVSALERNTARLALVRARAELADAQRLLAEARPRLAGALGLSARAVGNIDFLFDLAEPPDARNWTTQQAREAALLGRADVLGALGEYSASQSALQLEIAKQYPDIHLAPGYSWNAGSEGEHDWQLGATLELPILNRHQGPIAEAAARREASAAHFRSVQATAMNEVDVAVASFGACRTNLVAQDTLVTAQKTQVKVVEQQFQSGASDRLDVLSASLELNATRLTRLDAVVKLQQALGALEDAIQQPLDIPNAIFESGIHPRSE